MHMFVNLYIIVLCFYSVLATRFYKNNKNNKNETYNSQIAFLFCFYLTGHRLKIQQLQAPISQQNDSAGVS